MPAARLLPRTLEGSVAALIAYFRNRFVAELPLWRLRYWQIALLILWSTWPWLAQALFPGNSTLALAPVFIFLPIAYVIGGLFSATITSFAYVYPLGVSLTIFSIAYLIIVSWRRRLAKRPPP